MYLKYQKTINLTLKLSYYKKMLQHFKVVSFIQETKLLASIKKITE